MIYKIAKRSARSALGDDFAEVWYTFVRGFNRLELPRRSINDVFSDDPDKVRKEGGDQFIGLIDALVEQGKILRGILLKQGRSEDGEIKEAMLSLGQNLSMADVDLNIIRGNHTSKNKHFTTKFRIERKNIKRELLHARANIYLLASLKKAKK